MVWVKSYVAPAPTQDHKRLDALAHQFGVGVSTPSWSSRTIYFYESVSNGRKIQARLTAVYEQWNGGEIKNMEQLLDAEHTLTPEYKAKVAKYESLIQKREKELLIIEMKRVEEVSRLATIAQQKEDKRIEELRIVNDALARTTVNEERNRLSLELFASNAVSQNITFNEQINSGDFNETPITDINLSGGCSECTEPKHQMPDGSMMKDSDMEKGNNMKFAGIIAAGVIGLLLYTKGGLK